MRRGFVASPNYYNYTSRLCSSAGRAGRGQNSHGGMAISQWTDYGESKVVAQKLQVLLTNFTNLSLWYVCFTVLTVL